MAAISSVVSEKSKTLKVLGDAWSAHRFRNGAETVLQVPTQHDLGRGLAVFLG